MLLRCVARFVVAGYGLRVNAAARGCFLPSLQVCAVSFRLTSLRVDLVLIMPARVVGCAGVLSYFGRVVLARGCLCTGVDCAPL